MGFQVGLPETFVVDGVQCGVAAVAADAGSEIAVHSAFEDHGVWFFLHFDGEVGFREVGVIHDFDVGDHVGGLALGAGHGEYSTL